MFTEQQLKVLEGPLARERVKQRQGAGRQQLSYLEGWELIAEANRIFGFGNWSRETVIIEPLHDPKLVPDEEDASKAKVVACFFAKARVTVWSPEAIGQLCARAAAPPAALPRRRARQSRTR
jgi:recombination DNA repair RAD52 pathway protein